ncbi:hypothetical protein MMC17_004848, partial [Xylographa soralifera]|nr:hypothetical protein [Xylographa soralifera]
MLSPLLILLLAPFNVLTLPSPESQLVLQSVGSSVVQSEVDAATSSTVQLLYQFQLDDPVYLENLAPRSNGDLVLTASNKPFAYLFDPKARNKPPQPLPGIPGIASLTGIVETAPDVFAVVAGNWSRGTFMGVPGSFSIWSVDLTKPRPVVKKIVSIPEAHALNGITALEGSPNSVLIADSGLGTVWRLNVATGDYSIAIQSPLFTNSSSNPMGINGIRTFDGKLYFLNSAQRAYGRIALKPDGSGAGEVEIIARIDVPLKYDDFDMDWTGTAWIATHPNMLIEITIEGKQRNITGDGKNMDMAQPTSAQFGRGSKQNEHTVYMTTAGDNKVGGQIVAVN